MCTIQVVTGIVHIDETRDGHFRMSFACARPYSLFIRQARWVVDYNGNTWVVSCSKTEMHGLSWSLPLSLNCIAM